MAVVSTESKAFSKSMNDMYKGVFYSMHFSIIWLSVYMWSTVDLPGRKQARSFPWCFSSCSVILFVKIFVKSLYKFHNRLIGL